MKIPKGLPDCGVYSIKNLVTQNEYIGSSTQLQARLSKHAYAIINKRHWIKSIMEDCRVHGKDSFVIQILFSYKEKLSRLAYSSISFLRKKESELIKQREPKYNGIIGGSGRGAGRKPLLPADKKVVIRAWVKKKNAKRVREELYKIINLVDGGKP